MKILRKFYTTVLLAACLAGGAQALPEGASVVNGNVQITNSGGTQTIVQGSNQAIINWNGFNINVGELVQFIQPSSISAILNRVVGQDPSVILGSMKANGQVFLVNPNGVIFGEGSQIDVGSLVVSTLGISDDNFLQGNYHFEQAADKELASVINHGTIKIDDNGFLVLTGPMVANEGVILARVGQVALAGGTQSTVSFDPTGMIQVALPSGSQSNDGIVSLSTADTSDLLSSLVAGPAQAGQIVTRDGRTYLEVASGTVVNTGEIRAEGKDGQGGGRIVFDSTAHTLLADGSVQSAAGQGIDSPGGEIYVLSDGQAVSSTGSLIDVSGGASGDAGFVEQSSAYGLVAGSFDLSAQDGQAGELLIDPQRILVRAGNNMTGAGPNVVVVTEDFIEGTSVGIGTVNLVTQDGVDFEALNGGDLLLNSNINLTISLTRVGGDGTDAITFANPGDTITLQGAGAFTLTSVTTTDVNDLHVTTAGGNINVNLGGGAFKGANTFNTTNGSITITGETLAGDPMSSLQVQSTSGSANVTSTGTTLLRNTNVDTFTGRGQNFIFNGLNQATTAFDISVSGDVSGDLASFGGELQAPTVGVTAATIGLTEILEFDADTASLTANSSIYADYRPGTYSGNSVTVTNNNSSADTFVAYYSEGDLINDLGGMLYIDGTGVASLTYNTLGNRDVDVYEYSGDSLTLNTTGAVTGDAEVDGFLTVNAASIDILGHTTSGETYAGNNYDLTATGGNVLFNFSDFDYAVVNALASTGSVNVSSLGELEVDLTAANTIDVAGDSVYGFFDAPTLNATSYNYEIDLTQSGMGDTSVSADGAMGNASVFLTTNGNLSTRGINAFYADLIANGTSTITTASGLISAQEVFLDGGGGINVATATEVLTARSMGNITIDNQIGGGNSSVDLRTSPSSDIAFTTDAFVLDFPMGEGPILPSYFEGNKVTITAAGVDADVLANEVDASGGFVDLSLLSANTILDANSAFITATSIGDITTRAVQGGVVDLSTSGSGDIVKANSTDRVVASNFLSVDSAGLVDLLTTTNQMDVRAIGNIDIDNQSIGMTPLTVKARSFSNGTINLTTDGAIAEFDPFPAQGEVVFSELNGGTVNVTATDIFANFFADDLNATATSGNADLTIFGGPTNLTGSALGNFIVAANSDLSIGAAGVVAGGTIDLSAFTEGPTAITSSPGLIDAPTVILGAEIIDVDLGTSVTNLQTFSFGDTTVDANSAALTFDSDAFNLNINNTGGSLSGVAQASSQVNLSATDIMAQVIAPDAISIDATATAGNISLISNSVQSTVHANATGTVEVTAQSGPRGMETFAYLDTAGGNITGSMVTLHASDLGPTTVDSPDLVLDLTGSAPAVVDLLAATTSVTGTVNTDFTLNSANGNIAIGAAGLQSTNLGLGTFNALNGSVTSTSVTPGESVVDVGSAVVSADSANLKFGPNLAGLNSTTTGDGVYTATSAALAVSGSAGGNFSLTNTGSIDGTVPLNSVTGISGTNVNLVGSNVDAQITATTVDATATAGDVTLTSSSDLAIGTLVSAVNSVNISVSGGTLSGGGLIDAPNVDLSANAIDVNLGSNVTTLDAFSLAGINIDAMSDLLVNTATVVMPGSLTITNTGSITTGPTPIGGGGALIHLTGSDISGKVQGLTLDARANSGNVNLDVGGTPFLAADAPLGSVTLTGTGDKIIEAPAGFAGVTAGVAVDISSTGNLTSMGGIVDAPGVTLSGKDLDIALGNSVTTLDSTSVGNTFLQASSAGFTATGSTGAMSTYSLTTDAGAINTDLSGVVTENLVLNSAMTINSSVNSGLTTLDVTSNGDTSINSGTAAYTVTGTTGTGNTFSLTTTSGDLTSNLSGLVSDAVVLDSAANINTTVNSPSVIATANFGAVTLQLLSDSTVTGFADGLFDLDSDGNVMVGSPAGLSSNTQVNVTAFSGSITGPGNIDAPTVQLSAQSVDIDLGTNTANVLADATLGDVVLRGHSTTLDVTSTAFDPDGDVTVSNTGALTASGAGIDGDVVTLSGTSVSANLSANRVLATASTGDVDLLLFPASVPPTSVGGSAAGTFSANSFTEDLVVDAANITAGTSVMLSGGAITANGLVDSASVTLNADSVDVNLGTSVLNVNSTTNGNTVLHGVFGATFTGVGSTGLGSSYTLIADSGDIISDLSGVTTDSLVLQSPSTIDATVNSSIGALSITSNGDTNITANSAPFAVSGTTGSGNLFSLVTTTGDITSDLTGLSTDFLRLDSAGGVDASAAAPNVLALGRNGDVTLNLQAPSTVVDASDDGSGHAVTVNSTGDIVVGNVTGLTGSSVTVNNSTGSLTGSGQITAPIVDLTSDNIDIALGLGMEILTTNTTGNTTISTNFAAPVTASGSTGAGATYQFTTNLAPLTTDFSGLTTDNLVLNSAGIIDSTVNSSIGSLTIGSNGDATIQSASAPFSVSGSVGGGTTFTLMTTSGDITSDITGLNAANLILDSSGGINSSVAAPTVTANAANGDITLGLQAVNTTVDATANAAGGDITLNSNGNIVVGDTTGLVAGQSVTVNNPNGTLGVVSNNSFIDAPTVILNSLSIEAFLGSNVADLTTTSDTDTSITANSANINLTATTGPFGSFNFTNNGGAINGDLTNVMSNSIGLTATDIMATLSAATVRATATNGDVLLNLLAPSTTVTASALAPGGDVTLNSGGDIEADTFSGVQAANSVTVNNPTGALTGLIGAPTVDLTSNTIDVALLDGLNDLTSVSTGNTTIVVNNSPLTASGSTGSGATYQFTANVASLTTDFSGLTTDDLVLNSAGTIDSTVNSSIGSLTVGSNGDATIHSASAPFSVSGSLGGGTVFTLMTTSGDITSDLTGLSAANLLLESAGGINSSVAAPSVRASASNGDITLGLQAGTTTVDATAGAAGGDITLNSAGNIVVGTTTGLSANQSVTVNNTTGSLSGSGTIDAPTVTLDSNSINVILGSNVANLTTTSVGDTTITGNSTNINLTASSLSSGGAFNFINNVGAINGDLTNVMSNSIGLTATDIMATLSAATVSATATSGDVLLNLLAPSTTVTASATASGGDITVNSPNGDIVVGSGGLTANQSVSLNNTGHSISGSGTVNAPTVTVNSGTASLTTGANTSTLSLNLTGSGNVQGSSSNLSLQGSSSSGPVSVSNQGNLDSNFTLGSGTLSLTASGNLTGTAGADYLNLQAADIDMGVSGSVNAVALNGDVALTAASITNTAMDAVVSGSATGAFNATVDSGFTAGNISAAQIGLASTGGRSGSPGTISSQTGTRLSAPQLTLNAGAVSVDTSSTVIQANASSGGIDIRNTGSVTTVPTLSAPNGSITFSTNGNISGLSAQGLNANVQAGGFITGSVATNFATSLTGSTIDLTTLSANGVNVTTTTGNANFQQVNPTSGIFEVTADVAGDLGLTTTSGNILLYSVTADGDTNITAQAGSIVHNVESPGLLTTSSANLSALNDIVLNLNASGVRATSTSGLVNLTSVGTGDLKVAGAAAGNFTVNTSNGNLVHQDVSGANVTLNAGTTHDVSKDTTAGLSPVARITTAGTSTLTGRNVTADTNAGKITATAANDATISNFSSSVNNVNISAGHDASFTSVGTASIDQLSSTNNLTLDVGQAVTGSFTGNKVTLAGTSVTANVQANELTTTARSGDTTLTSNSTGKLTLTDNTASGNFSLAHKGDVEFNRIEAQNVTIDTTGNITDTANTIVANGITLNGNKILVTTQGQVISITAKGDVTVTNKAVNVNSLTVNADGSVDFGTEGNLNIAKVAGGPLVKLTVGGSITANADALVSAAKIQLAAGGNITPDLNNPLHLQATDSIEVTAHVVNLAAQGSSVDPNIAAALNGNLPASGVSVGSGSGPIYYNGALLNGVTTPTPPPVTPPNDAGNQIGQQNGQVLDDGSVGSAANDGIVEQSATQKLVSQLTEGGTGEGYETSALITLEVDALGELEVKLQQPSPFDESIDNSDNMSADDVLDLDTDELTDVKVALYYDPATDQLILAVDLRADDILDLDVSNFQEIPIKLDYSFLSDPKILIEKLRANDIIDLEVEDLGEIPIRVHVEGDDRSASE